MTTFQDLGFEDGDVVTCVSREASAPLGIVEKSFVLSQTSDGRVMIPVKGAPLFPYYGEKASWRKAEDDVDVSCLKENWETAMVSVDETC